MRRLPETEKDMDMYWSSYHSIPDVHYISMNIDYDEVFPVDYDVSYYKMAKDVTW